MKPRIEDIFNEAKNSDEFWLQQTIVDFTEGLVQRMEEQGITRTELAEKIGVQPAYITKVLRGNTNFTLESMVKLARAVNGKIKIKLDADSAKPQARNGRGKSLVGSLKPT